MFRPVFKIIITKRSFYPDDAVCLGSQLQQIIDFLRNVLNSHNWYAADVSALSELPRKLEINSFYIKKIGSDITTMELCNVITQFLSGVFFAIDINHSNQRICFLEVGTEDSQFREVDLNGILVEIRAIDTTFFEIYSEDKQIIEKIAIKFGIEIINK